MQLESIDWTLDLTFLTDITGTINSFNCKLRGKVKTLADISALNALRAKINIFSVHLLEKMALHFPQCT